MPDPTQPELPIGNVDASGEALDVAALVHPEQPPMDDAAGGPDSDQSDDDTADQTDIDAADTDDLTVQGGE